MLLMILYLALSIKLTLACKLIGNFLFYHLEKMSTLTELCYDAGATTTL